MATYTYVLVEADKDMTYGKKPGGAFTDLQTLFNDLGAEGYTLATSYMRAQRLYFVMQKSSADP